MSATRWAPARSPGRRRGPSSGLEPNGSSPWTDKIRVVKQLRTESTSRAASRDLWPRGTPPICRLHGHRETRSRLAWAFMRTYQGRRGRSTSKGVFKCCTRHARLSDDALQSASPQLVVQRHGHGGCRLGRALLHHDVATALTDSLESVVLQDSAHLVARESPELSQPGPLPE
jgi:hypothetical protein